MRPKICKALACLTLLGCLLGLAQAEEGPWMPDCASPAAEKAEAGLSNFKKTAEYTPQVYTDVAEGEWYRAPVALAYELGLMVGSDGTFSPAGRVTAAETLVVAAKLHVIYETGEVPFTPCEPWYSQCADYCLENGIIDALPDNYDRALTRSEFAAVLARALPEETRPAIRTVEDDQLPDVKVTDPNGAAIYSLYRAGILSGSDRYGSYLAGEPIQRCEVAAILTGMVDPARRSSAPLTKLTWPQLLCRERWGDEHFTRTALVGNSLIQGLQLYSGLKSTADFYCYQGVTVYTVGEYVEKLCEKQYDKVYLELGINEIYLSADVFAAEYAKAVDRIRAAMPEADIFLMAITPVTRAVSDKGSFTMARIGALNAALQRLAEEKQCWYLDSCTLLCDSTGYLPADYVGWDGSPHLSTAGYQAWEELIRTWHP